MRLRNRDKDKREQAISKELAQVPVKYRGIMKRAFEGTASPTEVIKAKCLECMGYRRTDIRDCSSLLSPLWLYRPYQKK